MNEATGTVPRARKEINLTPKQERNFWAKVNKDGPLPDQTNPHYTGFGPCWVWTAATVFRYGQFSAGRRSLRAHRVAWVLANGQIPHNLDICHRCDVPNCVNSDHLFLGTNEDNSRDREIKGRGNQARGDKNGARTKRERWQASVKLNPAQVLEIRSLYATSKTSYHKLAAQFGVHFTTIGYVITRKIWTHI